MHDLSIMSRMGCRAAWADSTRGYSAGQHVQHEQHGHGSIYIYIWNRAQSGPTRAQLLRTQRQTAARRLPVENTYIRHYTQITYI